MWTLIAVGLGAMLGLSLGAEGARTEPEVDAWQEINFPSVARATEYHWDHATMTWTASAVCSASAMVLPLDGLDLGATPRLRWQWRVLEGMTNQEEQSREGDDFAARVTLMFREPNPTLWHRVRRAAREVVAGSPLPDYALTFVWADRLAVGTRWASPHSGPDFRLEVLSRGAASNRWQDVEVDAAASVRRALGKEPGTPFALAIMTDSDDLCARARAEYGRFQWLPASESPLETER